MKTILKISIICLLVSNTVMAQDTTNVDLGKSGAVTIIDKGSTNEITIDTDSIEDIVGAVAENVLKSMSNVMNDLFETLAITMKEIEQMDINKTPVTEKLNMDELNTAEREAIEEMHKELEQDKEALELQRKELKQAQEQINKEYQEQVKKYAQYKQFSEIYRDNEKELRNSNGKVTIEVQEPILSSPSYKVAEHADTTEIKVIGKTILKVIEGDDNTELSIGGYSNVQLSEGNGDTVIIRLGNKVMRVVDNGNDSKVEFDRVPKHQDDVIMKDDNERKSKHHSSKPKNFKGHWSVIELGRNTFTKPDYALYASPDDFMELNYNKSIEFNINPFRYSVGLLGNRRKGTARLGLITGLGFSWNNYRFDNAVTVDKVDNMLMPVSLDPPEYSNIEKSKLTALYMTVPLIMEFQFPGNNKFYISGGGIGAIKLASHTKIKEDGNKTKDHGNFYMAPFRYGVTTRLGYNKFCIYGSYYFSEMFIEKKGPIMTPYTIGIGIGI